MKKTKDLHLRLNQLKMKIRPERLKGTQKAYLRRFIVDNKWLTAILGAIIIAESLLMVSLPIILKYLVERDYNLFRLENLIGDLVLLAFLIVFFLITSFAIIRIGQILSFNLINQIKRHWLIYFFQTPSNESSKLSDGSLMAKMLYHTQLLRMGLERVIMEGGRAVVFYVVVLIAAFFFSSSSFFWLAVGFPLICLVTYIAFLIGRYYISQEQTLNTRFVKVLFHQMNNLCQIQSLGLAQDRFHELNQIIEQDTYFRKRRETWLKFSDRLIFALILLVGGMLYLVKDFYPILHWNNWSEGAVGIVLTGYFAKILMQSVHAGIFWQALKTGALISVPEFTVGPNPLGEKSNVKFSSSLTIQGKRAKLSKFGSPIKHFRLVLEPGSKTLIVGEGPVGKTTLAKYLCGLESVDSLNVKNNGNFMLSHIWCGHNRDRQLISLTLVFRETVAEFLLAQPAEELDHADLDNIFQRLKKYPEFDFIFKFKEFLGKRFDSLQGSLTELALLQIAQSILRKPKLICVDNSIFDLPNPLVQEGLLILAKECEASTIVYFTVEPKHAKNFKQVCHLTEKDFTTSAADA